MDILLQSDGQLYPPRHADRPPQRPKPKPPPAPKPPAPKPPSPCPEPVCKPESPALPWEDLLLIGIAFLLLRSSDQPDIPLLLALAYILFDQNFSLKNLI